MNYLETILLEVEAVVPVPVPRFQERTIFNFHISIGLSRFTVVEAITQMVTELPHLEPILYQELVYLFILRAVVDQ